MTTHLPDTENSVSELLKEAKFEEGIGLSHQIVIELSRLIETIKLRPGALISENEIAEALNISKTPVREALIKLEEINFVKIVPRVGSYVSKINIDNYLEACFVRISLESGAVRAAARQAGVSTKESLLYPLIEQQQQALEDQEHEAFYQLDQAFHKAFFQLADVPGVWSTIKRSQTDVNRIRHLKRKFGISRAAQVIQEHQNIASEICAGNAAGAERALVQHIGSLDKEINTLSANPDLMTFIDTLNAAQPRRRNRQEKTSQ